MNETRVFVCRVATAEGDRDYVTLSAPATAFSRGLPPEAIVGVLAHPLRPDEPITPDIFSANRVFIDFLHQVIARQAPHHPGLQAEARRLGQGFVYIIDQRTRDPSGSVPPEDIIGAVEVEGGEVVQGSYRRNPNHVLLSSAGFFRLDANLHQFLLEALAARASEQ